MKYTGTAADFPNATPETRDAVQLMINALEEDKAKLFCNKVDQVTSARMLVLGMVMNVLLCKEASTLSPREHTRGAMLLAQLMDGISAHCMLFGACPPTTSICELIVGAPES